MFRTSVVLALLILPLTHVFDFPNTTQHACCRFLSNARQFHRSIGVVTISSVCAILVILAFNILKNNTIGAGVGLLMFVFISISYLCGGFQLSSAMGGAKKKDPKIDFIVSSAKRISGVSGLVVLSMLFYAVIRTLKRYSLVMGFLESLAVHCILFTIATAFYFQQVRAEARNEKERERERERRTDRQSVCVCVCVNIFLPTSAFDHQASILLF